MAGRRTMNIILYVKYIASKEFRTACKKAELELAKDVLKDTDEFVPFLTGTFSKNARVQGNVVVYIADWVRYLYYGKVMVDEQGRHAVFYDGVGWRHRKHARLHPIDKDLVFTKTYHPKAQARWMEASYAQNVDKWAGDAERAVSSFLDR